MAEQTEATKTAKKASTAQLERQYTIPLRKEWLKAPEYKRAKKAVKAIKQFIARHMKVPERDIRKVKVDKWLNEEIWFRGIRKPPAKIKVKAVREAGKDNIVRVELAEIPEVVKFRIEREKKSQEKAKLSEKEKAKEVKAKAEEEKKLEEKVETAAEAEKTEEEKREEEKEEILKKQKMKQKIERIKEKGKPKEVGKKEVQQFRMALQK